MVLEFRCDEMREVKLDIGGRELFSSIFTFKKNDAKKNILHIHESS